MAHTMHTMMDGDRVEAYITKITEELEMDYICSPFTAPTAEEVEFNVKIARALCIFDFEQLGSIPVASHVFYPGIVYCVEYGGEQGSLGAVAGLKLLSHCDRLILFDSPKGITLGMQVELLAARRFNIPIYRLRQDTVDLFLKYEGDYPKIRKALKEEDKDRESLLREMRQAAGEEL